MAKRKCDACGKEKELSVGRQFATVGRFILIVVASALIMACANSGRPSEAEVKSCVASNAGVGSGLPRGDIGDLQFGTTTTSQGGIMDYGAAKGTTMFPAKFKLVGDGFEWHILMFKDAFGKWQCFRAN